MADSGTSPRGFAGRPLARRYEHKDEATWDAFVADAWNGTLLHTRRYLSYHRDRFEDRSLVIEESGRVVGLLPAAVDPADERNVVSHPGITYGGLVTRGDLRGEAAISAFEACVAVLQGDGHDQLTYKSIPTLLHRFPTEDDLYALWRLGATLARTDLWAWVPAHGRRSMSRVRQRALRRAAEESIVVRQDDLRRLPEFWDALGENLRARHGVSPTHTLDEITTLVDRFPDRIALHVGVDPEGALLAGALTFQTPGAVHIQYSSPTEAGREVGALDAVYDSLIRAASAAGLATSFGSSTEAGGQVLNTSLYHFKATFGAASLAHQFFTLPLS
ncbi:MAG TPA: GNAT family N-acetyltransferase [Candidatus Dormibacteraeota bacterium]